MRTLLTNTRMAVVVSAAMALLVAPLGAQTRHGGARLPSRPVVRQEAAHRGDAHDRPGKGKAKGKHKNHRDRYVVIDGRVCRVKENKNGDRATYKCRRQDDRTYGDRNDRRGRTPRVEPTSGTIASRVNEVWNRVR